MPATELLAALDEMDADDESVLRMEPAETFDQCVIGLVERFNSRFLVYDRECVLKAMLDSSSPEETDDEDPEDIVMEYYRFNTLGAWLGDGTPGFLMKNPEEL